MPLHFASDVDVAAIPAVDVVEMMREAFRMHDRGEIDAPARLVAPITRRDDFRLVFTVGGTDEMLGFRLYAMGKPPLLEQLTALYEPNGDLAGVVTGLQLGARRTGALGAVAADYLARPDASVMGIIGTGLQATAHVWAVNAVRPLTEIRVFSRNEQRRLDFARHCEDELGLTCRPMADAEAAIRGADLVTLATTSMSPAIDAMWVEPGMHVATLGPKSARAHEAPQLLSVRAEDIVTDSLAQLHGFGEPSWLTLEEGQLDRVRPLSPIVAGRAPGRTRADDVTLFCSVGLAGTELFLARAVLDRVGAGL
jgi:ornithine cyclodeaminase